MQTLPDVKEEQSRKAPARLGLINFINSLPVAIPLLKRCHEIKADIVLGTPSELNKQYADNKLDLGAMSSFFFLESGDMQLLPEISISSVGAVGSVLFFSKKNPADLDKCRIAVPKSSATSINLLRVLLKEDYGVEPILTTEAAPDLERDVFDAALVIGDRALLVDPEWTTKYHRLDMGSWWFSNYKLPMTFGVWAAKNAFVEDNNELFSELCQTHIRARKEGLTADLDAVIDESIERLPMTRERLQKYFLEELNFEFTPAHDEGLKLYRSLCQKHGLLDSNS
ncbi:MAG TPA: menaquinone biosynthesis protein [Drouetiella sp.]